MTDPQKLRAEQDRQFAARYRQYTEYGQWSAFALATVVGSMEQIAALKTEEGARTVATREGDYRNWDPDVLAVDSVAEGYIFQRIEQFAKMLPGGFRATVLSEEAGRKQFDLGDQQVYIVSDPFDGSLLYKNDMGAFYFTTVAVFDRDGRHLATAIGDIVNRRVDFASDRGAWTARLDGDRLIDVKQPAPGSADAIAKAVLETYLLKPKYLYQEADDAYSFAETLKPLLSSVKFIHANGGPGGFADVAFGRVDVYLAHKQPFIDVFSGLGVAQQAGVVVTTFDGEPLTFTPDVNQRLYVVCSANRTLHQAVLDCLRDIRAQHNIEWRKVH
ncbi:MAG TPA: inositol monophosphatase family protein [Phycisphaerae bacterium]|nr:inositol monophosphatase family protein [Phycisphaerae bacterium]